jgi:hypothetical protein
MASLLQIFPYFVSRSLLSKETSCCLAKSCKRKFGDLGGVTLTVEMPLPTGDFFLGSSNLAFFRDFSGVCLSAGSDARFF